MLEETSGKEKVGRSEGEGNTEVRIQKGRICFQGINE
jgi:hypothetical protein